MRTIVRIITIVTLFAVLLGTASCSKSLYKNNGQKENIKLMKKSLR